MSHIPNTDLYWAVLERAVFEFGEWTSSAIGDDIDEPRTVVKQAVNGLRDRGMLEQDGAFWMSEAYRPLGIPHVASRSVEARAWNALRARRGTALIASAKALSELGFSNAKHIVAAWRNMEVLTSRWALLPTERGREVVHAGKGALHVLLAPKAMDVMTTLVAEEGRHNTSGLAARIGIARNTAKLRVHELQRAGLVEHGTRINVLTERKPETAQERRIVAAVRGGARTSAEVAAKSGLHKSTASKHISMLRADGVLSVRSALFPTDLGRRIGR